MSFLTKLFIKDLIIDFLYYFQDMQQIVNRYESLVYMAQDTEQILEASSDVLASLKVTFSNLFEYASDQAMRSYEVKNKLQSELVVMKTQNSRFGEEKCQRTRVVIQKCVDFGLIFKSVNNLFALLSNAFNSNLRWSSSVYESNEYSRKLKVIKENFNDIKDIYLCLHADENATASLRAV